MAAPDLTNRISRRKLIPLRAAAPVDHAAARMCQGGNLLHFRRRQFEIEQRNVFRQPLDLRGTRNDDDVALREPAQRDLARGLAVRLPDALEPLVLAHLPARERAIGRDRKAVLAAGGRYLRLIEIGMAFDLVGRERLACG